MSRQPTIDNPTDSLDRRKPREEPFNSRRSNEEQSSSSVLGFAAGIALAGVGLPAMVAAQAPKVLKISHQFPASTGEDGDFRDPLAKKFAAEVEKRTNGQIKIEVYPNGSLVKTFSQFGALRKGTLDMSVLPVAYGGGEVPEANLGLMPALVTSYDQGLRWKNAPSARNGRRSSTTRASSS
jgi:TRAP-type C4-dicarboxylate transport system substrate-binding protein